MAEGSSILPKNIVPPAGFLQEYRICREKYEDFLRNERKHHMYMYYQLAKETLEALYFDIYIFGMGYDDEWRKNDLKAIYEQLVPIEKRTKISLHHISSKQEELARKLEYESLKRWVPNIPPYRHWESHSVVTIEKLLGEIEMIVERAEEDKITKIMINFHGAVDKEGDSCVAIPHCTNDGKHSSHNHLGTHEYCGFHKNNNTKFDLLKINTILDRVNETINKKQQKLKRKLGNKLELVFATCQAHHGTKVASINENVVSTWLTNEDYPQTLSVNYSTDVIEKVQEEITGVNQQTKQVSSGSVDTNVHIELAIHLLNDADLCNKAILYECITRQYTQEQEVEQA